MNFEIKNRKVQLVIFCVGAMIALVVTLFAQTPETQVKQELNEAARAYREGKFADAQVHAEKALQLDPQNKTAPFFVARTIHAQYRPGVSTPENDAKAREAISAYQRVLARSPEDDEAYKAIAYLYGALKEDELLNQWILQRAGNVSFPNDKRAEAYIVLASKEWDCSFKITELPGHKITTFKDTKAYVSYKMPKERADFERATECANHGLELANMAIILAPKNESAWSYKTNILLELGKLAEMSGQMWQKREFQRQYEEALKETTRLSKSSPDSPN